MPNTYTQLYIQVVFAVKFRQKLITEEHREEVEKIITGMISYKKCKPIAIYCNPDHIHMLIGLHPEISISSLVREVKSASSKLINEKAWFPGKFSWQDGYGAFSYKKKSSRSSFVI